MIENIRFELHPLVQEDSLIIDNYISGLYNLALCDGKISEQEEDYINRIITKTNISKERLERIKYIEFNKNIEVLK